MSGGSYYCHVHYIEILLNFIKIYYPINNQIMALSDFFRINLPYGIKRNSSDEWFAFNREYMPLGWNTTRESQSIFIDSVYKEFPIYTKYKGLTEKLLLKIAHDPAKGIGRDSEGRIDTIFFYSDATNPQSNANCWGSYFDKIKLLSKLEKK